MGMDWEAFFSSRCGRTKRLAPESGCRRGGVIRQSGVDYTRFNSQRLDSGLELGPLPQIENYRADKDRHNQQHQKAAATPQRGWLT